MIAVVIPAFDPPPSLASFVRTLAAQPRIARIIVVDDGSKDASQAVFRAVAETPRTTVLRQPVNLGKGAALKRAFNHIWQHGGDASTIVTADADGQHLPEDVVRVGEIALSTPESVVLGVRQIGAEAPFRSRVGNAVTRRLYGWVVGQRLRDTQTGLRAVPRALLPALLALSGSGYEYELGVLIHCRQASVPIVEVPIATVYLEGNRSSHFQPLRDSCRVYLVLLKFGAVSLASTIVDNAVYIAALAGGVGQPGALGLARLVSAGVNYPLVKHWVFSQAVHALPTLGPYAVLVSINVLAAAMGTRALQDGLGLSALASKMVWETVCFLPNFLLQRDIVFRAPRRGAATDWTAYYASVPLTARLTRRYTARRLVAALRAGGDRGSARTVAELGGAASCFVDRVCEVLAPERYVVLDSNRSGLSKLQSWTPPPGRKTALELIATDIRTFDQTMAVDSVFSVGLIEHFAPAETRDVLAAHFALVKHGGVVVVSYPTPTWLYRATRRVLELLRLWRFPDERPLTFAEVAQAAAGRGAVIQRQILWPLMLTQEMVVFVKR